MRQPNFPLPCEPSVVVVVVVVVVVLLLLLLLLPREPSVVAVDTDDMCRRVAALWCEVHDQSGHGSRPHNYPVKIHPH